MIIISCKRSLILLATIDSHFSNTMALCDSLQSDSELPCTPSSVSSNSEDPTIPQIPALELNVNEALNHRLKQIHIVQRDSEPKSTGCFDLKEITKKKYDSSLVYGLLFSNKYKYHILCIIESHFISKPIDIGTVAKILMPIILTSPQSALYQNQTDLVQYSLYRLFCHFSEKCILKHHKESNHFLIGRKFKNYLLTLKRKMAAKQQQKSQEILVETDDDDDKEPFEIKEQFIDFNESNESNSEHRSSLNPKCAKKANGWSTARGRRAPNGEWRAIEHRDIQALQNRKRVHFQEDIEIPNDKDDGHHLERENVDPNRLIYGTFQYSDQVCISNDNLYILRFIYLENSDVQIEPKEHCETRMKIMVKNGKRKKRKFRKKMKKIDDHNNNNIRPYCQTQPVGDWLMIPYFKPGQQQIEITDSMYVKQHIDSRPMHYNFHDSNHVDYPQSMECNQQMEPDEVNMFHHTANNIARTVNKAPVANNPFFCAHGYPKGLSLCPIGCFQIPQKHYYQSHINYQHLLHQQNVRYRYRMNPKMNQRVHLQSVPEVSDNSAHEQHTQIEDEHKLDVISIQRQSMKLSTACGEAGEADNKCIECGVNDVNWLFLPCRHWCVCMECGKGKTHCSLCQKEADKGIKIEFID